MSRFKRVRESQHVAFSRLFTWAHTLSGLDGLLSQMDITTNSCLDHILPSTNSSIVCVHECARVEDEKKDANDFDATSEGMRCRGLCAL